MPAEQSWFRWFAVAAAVSVVLLASAGVALPSGPSTSALVGSDSGRQTARQVLIVSIPGLQWQDLDGSDTPYLDSLLGARALGSVRTDSTDTSPLDGYLTVGAGNRVAIDRAPADVTMSGTCIDPAVMAEARDAADDQLSGAEPGALGAAIHAAGASTIVFGSPAAAVALADAAGCVDRYSAMPGDVGGTDDDVVLLELTGLERSSTAQERMDRLVEIDALLAATPAASTSAQTSRLTLVIAPAAPDDASEVTAFGASHVDGGRSTSVGLAASGTTRRGGYITMADVAPTVLAALGAAVPESMAGTEIRVVDDVSPARATDASMSDLADRVEFRDRAVGPVAVIFVVFISLTGLCALGRRGRMARMFGPITAAYAGLTFLSGLVALHHLPLDFVVVATPVTACFVAALAAAGWSRWGRWAPTTALLTLLWVVLLVDVVTGGALQINTVLGYTPTIAGRFQGFGNLASALIASSGLAVAVIPVMLRDPGAATSDVPTVATRGELLWMGWVAAITLIAVAAPAFGSDVGGTLTLVPVVVILAMVATGRRVDLGKLVLALGLGVVVVVALAAADLARPAASRTHLGRFADQVIHGEAGTILQRKLRGNLAILTSSFWTFVLLAIFLAALVLAWRRRERLAELTAGRPALRIFPIGFTSMGLIGLFTNDSGIVIPGIMLGVGIPWIVSVVFAPTVRAGR